MKILAVLAHDPFAENLGISYGMRATLSMLNAREELFVTGFGDAFAQDKVSGMTSLGSLGQARNSPLGMLDSLLHGRAYSFDKYKSDEACQRLRSYIAQCHCELVWYEQIQLAAPLFDESVRTAAHVRNFIRSHNVEYALVGDRYSGLMRLAAPLMWLEARFLRRGEIRLLRLADHVFTVSSEDCELYRRLSGVSTIDYMPTPFPKTALAVRDDLQARRNILFAGNCSWGPNWAAARWIVRQLAPVLQRRLPEFRIRMVGRGSERLQAERRSENIDCAGFVDDIAAEYQSALCAIAPITLGGGINIKVTEALTLGLPVIGSAFAQRGVEGGIYRTAETPEEYADRIEELSSEPDLAENARLAALRLYDDMQTRFDRLWRKAVADASL